MRRLVILATLLTPGLSAADGIVHVLEPGFRSRPLPLALTNANALAFGPDQRLYALMYDGRVLRLIDTDGDGLQDRAEPYWEPKSLVSPIQMLWAPEGLYVTSHRKLSLLRDDDHDGRAEREEVIAEGWPPIPTGSNLVDAMGLARDREGNLYVNVGCVDFTNPYLLKDGTPHYDPRSELGAVLKISAGGKTREVFANGFRFCYALEFNRAGDLFATDQEGETWLKGANPLDELNHVERGRHYGWPPRHPQYLPANPDTPPVVGFAPQHQSACGLEFNEPRDGRQRFGPPAWEGNALVAGFSRGKVWRVELVKTPAGYVGRPSVLLASSQMVSDLAIAPDGALYLSCHSGEPDWGTGPQGQGTIVRIELARPEAPRPVLAWAAGPLEVRVAFDRPVDEAAASAAPAMRTTYGPHVRAGDRFETLRPPYKAVEQQQAEPPRILRTAAARLEDNGRTLVLMTDPHPQDAHYALTLPGLRPPGAPGDGETADLDYSLNGVEMTWAEPDAAEPAVSLWWPHFDPAVVRVLTAGSIEHERALVKLGQPGRLTLRSLVSVPEGELTVRLRSSVPIAEAALGGEPAEISDDQLLAVMKAEATGPPIELLVSLPTGTTPDLSVSLATAIDPTERPLPLERLSVPWSPGPPPPSAAPPSVPPALAGGDPKRGEALFFGDEAKCSACHKFRGQGGDIGPDLSNLPQRDVASIVRDIQDPSTVINPDYVPYTVALKDGRVAVGVVRADGADAIQVLDTNAQSLRVKRAEITDIQPSRTSIMPVGLAGALGEARLRDLIAYLTAEAPVAR